MTFCLTIADLNRLRPCEGAGYRVRALLRKFNPDEAHCFTAAEAKAAGCTFDNIVWAAEALARKDPAVARCLRLWKSDCAARVLSAYEAECPGDERVRNAIKASRDFANGKIDEAALYAAARAAHAARAAAARAAAAHASRAATYAANAAAAGLPALAYRATAAAAAAAAAASAAAASAATAAAAAAAAASAAAAAAAAASATEGQWQFNRLIRWLSNPEPKPLRLPKEPAR